MKIQPLNGHILIKPLKHEDFVEGANSYDEMGEVLSVGDQLIPGPIVEGDIVLFDSFLVAKYPGETIEEPIWLVDFKDVRGKKEKDAT